MKVEDYIYTAIKPQLAGHKFIESKIYVNAPSEVPKGYTIKTGKRGGIYYEPRTPENVEYEKNWKIESEGESGKIFKLEDEKNKKTKYVLKNEVGNDAASISFSPVSKNEVLVSEWQAEERGKGYGKKLLGTILDKIYPDVTTINTNGMTEEGRQNMQKVLEPLGFKRVGLKFSKASGQAKPTSEIFDVMSTGMPVYDNLIKNPEYHKKEKGMIGEVVYMSPDEFLEEAQKRSGVSEKIFDSMIDRKLAGEYSVKMKGGRKFDMPVLDGNEHEGRHRAYAAKLAGMDRIPVLVVRRNEYD